MAENLIALFQYHVSKRYQYVRYNPCSSSAYEAYSGVPQGCDLGPFRFLIFVNYISAMIDVEFHIFANGLKLYQC